MQVDAFLLPQSQDSMVASVTVARDASGRESESGTYQPTCVDLNRHVIPLATKIAKPTTWKRPVATVGALGGCTATPPV
jgi:hypothetical protein